MPTSAEVAQLLTSTANEPAKALRDLFSSLEQRTSIDLMTPLQKGVRQLLVARGVYSGEVDLGDYRLHHYRVGGAGEGPPVVFVHGLAGSATGFARLLLPLTKRFRQVWAVDLPGHGFSPEPNQGRVTLERQLDALQRFTREVVGGPVMLVGNSLGGAISMQMAAEAPELIRSVALLAPAGAQVSPERFQELIDCLQVETNAHARALLRRLFVRVSPIALALAGQMRQMYGCDAVRSLLEDALARPHIDSEMLKRLQQPVLLLWGGSEKLLPHEGVEYFRAHLPEHAKIEVVEGWGHVPQMEHPDAVVDRLIRFADETSL